MHFASKDDTSPHSMCWVTTGNHNKNSATCVERNKCARGHLSNARTALWRSATFPVLHYFTRRRTIGFRSSSNQTRRHLTMTICKRRTFSLFRCSLHSFTVSFPLYQSQYLFNCISNSISSRIRHCLSVFYNIDCNFPAVNFLITIIRRFLKSTFNCIV